MQAFGKFDVIRLIRHSSWLRIWNAVRVFSSYYLSKWTGKVYQWGSPISISFEPTTACNLRCPECPSGLRSFTRPTGNVRTDFFRSAIDQLAPTLSSLMFYFQGEPYIHPQFLDMVSYAESKGIYTITSTNGHFLSQANAEKTITSNLSRIIISVDGTNQETYQKYRKEGDLHQVLEGAKRLVAARSKAGVHHPYIIFQFLVVKPNEHQIPEIHRLAREIGIDEVKLKTAQLYDYKDGHELMPQQSKYSRYQRLENGQFAIKNKLQNHCWKLWHACVITWDGTVVPCCFDKDASHKMGDLKSTSFSQIWQGERYQEFRSDLMTSRKSIDICQNCTEGINVWAD
ncbi:MAG: SPASM domain-containing protein [Saprospiraceae bacterium]|nr:SPASM domain-containing protein [Saprospiraceae bacterium]MBK6477117.1 SPASM domain-containing protein [Saprospiraceae bacterium]MBK6814583.1 SPASM domain-containing protein [Saprospiraceae bacterium]MBK7369969.1 SPASM domain-containing protein [Saprospiraceae bacterium]MBK7437673.1 SPASM domain-containing protein [Saprospiraceae bacterium]